MAKQSDRTSSAAGSRAKTSATHLEGGGRESLVTALGSIAKLCESLAPSDRDGSSSRTQTGPHGESGCPSCGASFTASGSPACRFECAPRVLVPHSKDLASLSLPRPTAKANQLAPSMRKWPSCLHLQELVGRTGGSPHPELWEWLMGFPIGWSDSRHSVTQWSRNARRSSGTRSSKSPK